MDTMTPDADERRLTEYLLGQLPPDEAAALEERYLGDPAVHDQLRAVERDLIDRYVRGELSDAETFERRYLSSPSRRAKVEFARALMQTLAPPVSGSARAGPGTWWAPHLSGVPAWPLAAGIAVAMAGAWLVFTLSRSGPGPASAPGVAATDKSQVPGATPLPGSSSTAVTPQPSVALLVLVPSAVRASDAAPATVPIGGETAVRLQLEMEAADYPQYRVIVREADGREVWREDGLTPARSGAGPSVATTIPARRLVEGDYTVRVAGFGAGGDIDEVSGYAFRVVRP
jgi:hypothetical protein